MVPGFDRLLADALGRQNCRAGGVWSAWWLGQVVVERLERVADRGVVEEPREELRVTLGELDGQAGDDASGRTSCATDSGGAAGRLNVGHGRAESDHPDVGEYGLGDHLGWPRWRCGADGEHGDAGRRDDSDVVTQRDVAGDSLLLTRWDCHGDVAAGTRQVGRSCSGNQPEVIGEHVRRDHRSLGDLDLCDEVNDIARVRVHVVDAGEAARNLRCLEVRRSDRVTHGNGLLRNDYRGCRRAADASAPTDRSTEEEDAGAGEDGEQQTDDDEKTSTAWSRSCW